MSDYSYDLLVVYNRRDAQLAEGLANGLRKLGVRVWFDRWDMVPGQPFQQGLVRAFRESRAVAVCVGTSGAPHGLELLLEARPGDSPQPLIPVLLEGAKVEGLPDELKGFKALAGDGSGAPELVDKLADALLSMGQSSAANNLLKASEQPEPPKGFLERVRETFRHPARGGRPIVEDEAAGVVPGDARRQGGAAALTTLALQILRGQHVEPRELLRLAAGLKAEKSFGLARRILERARLDPALGANPPLRLRVYQQLALCTYKDPDLPTGARLDRALVLLREGEDLAETRNQETLGLAGAIYKRMWEVDEQKANLERSLFYYLRGYAQGAKNDQGYTAINAAFVLDLLARQEEEAARSAGVVSPVAQERRAKAREIREEIVWEVAPLIKRPDTSWLAGQWWFYSTVAEAHFGLGEYEQALEWLEQGRSESLAVEDREYESTVRQLATLARLACPPDISLEELERTNAWVVLASFFSNDMRGVQSAFVGKVGLALSGGGFRASLFHIGVLARLAELDVLRHVEALSCVSGGSIVGAHYYLEVRRLLQSKRDEEITREDYVSIVQRLEHDFLAGVQRNLRMRVAADWLTGVRLIFKRNFSRVTRVGELYEREIFSRVQDGEGDGPRWLNELSIRPAGEAENFRPEYDNWRRTSKVPALILNATTLNTGHNWQFTTGWMGEPSAGISVELDGNELLRRMYYDEAPPRHRRVRLGHAVAASACVPGIYEPLPLAGLYPEHVVRLVDGGVHDNQGVAALLTEDCNVLLVSDASGQMATRKDPSSELLSVSLRSTEILMSRVREAEYRELEARLRSSLARGVMFLHLKKDLDVRAVDWVGCDTTSRVLFDVGGSGREGTLTRYGMPKDVQELLADIRSDFDSFSDREAYALMLSGYKMTAYEFPLSVKGFQTPAGAERGWRFLQMEDYIGPGAATEERLLTTRLLRVAGRRSFKVWRVSRPLQILASVVFGALAVSTAWAAWNWGGLLRAWLDEHAALAATALAALILIPVLAKMLNRGKAFSEIAVGFGTALFGFALARVHLLIFDKLYLRLGRIRR